LITRIGEALISVTGRIATEFADDNRAP